MVSRRRRTATPLRIGDKTTREDSVRTHHRSGTESDVLIALVVDRLGRYNNIMSSVHHVFIFQRSDLPRSRHSCTRLDDVPFTD